MKGVFELRSPKDLFQKLEADFNRIDADALMRYAQTCRVAYVMRPYLEAVL